MPRFRPFSALLPTLILGLGLLPFSPVRGETARLHAPVSFRHVVSTSGASHLPILFESNRGQVDGRVAFLAHFGGATLALTRDGALLSLIHPPARTAIRSLQPPSASPGTVVQIRTLEVSSHARFVGMGRQPSVVNYLVGSRPTWRTDVPTYARVEERDVYPGIDLAWYGGAHGLEYDWIVHPGADPLRIAQRVVGSNRLRLDVDGSLLVYTGVGTLRQALPVASQTVGGRRVGVPAHYLLGPRGVIRLHVGSYDHARPLLLDPTLGYSTYFGGTGSDALSGGGVAVDARGNSYITGLTASADFPTLRPVQSSIKGNACGTTVKPAPCWDAIVARFDAQGQLLSSTYLGGVNDDVGSSVAIDPAGNIYIAGATRSPDFPSVHPAAETHACAYQETYDGFLTKLNPTADAIVYSMCLGGSKHDELYDLAVTSDGQVWATGFTQARDFPSRTTTAWCASASFSCADAVVVGLDASGSHITHMTAIGGHNVDYGDGIALDREGNVYVIGSTMSPEFPVTAGALQPRLAGIKNAFVLKITGDQLVYSTYLGGAGQDLPEGIAVDGNGNAYVTGNAGPGFPVVNAVQSQQRGGACADPANLPIPCADAFLAKIDPSGTRLLYSTYLGGEKDDEGIRVAVDAAGVATVTGFTDSNTFPVLDPIQAGIGNPNCASRALISDCSDAFVAQFSPLGSLRWSTYLGGNRIDVGRGVALGPEGSIFVTGRTASPDFPTSHAFQPALSGSPGISDFFLTRITAPAMETPTATTVPTAAAPGGTATPVPTAAPTATAPPTSTPAPTATAVPTATTVPTATATATPAPPSAKAILNEYSKAVAKKNSYHVDETAKETTSSGQTATAHVTIDAVIKPAAQHMVTTTVGGTDAGRSEMIQVGPRVATRKDNQKWNCTGLTVPAASNPGNALQIYLLSGQGKATNRGEATVSATPAWHVHFVLTLGGPIPSITEELYFRQSDKLLVKSTMAWKFTDKGVTQNITATARYSQYGKHLVITWPADCAKKTQAAVHGPMATGVDPLLGLLSRTQSGRGTTR